MGASFLTVLSEIDLYAVLDTTGGFLGGDIAVEEGNCFLGDYLNQFRVASMEAL